MNTNFAQGQKNIDTAIHYYRSMQTKDFDTMGQYLHPEVQLMSPLSTLSGKEAVIEAAKEFSNIIKNIDIRATFGNKNQAMLVYDFILAQPMDKLKASVFMNFTNGFISKIELFFDSRSFQ